MEATTFATNLRTVRESRGMTQAQLAEACAMNQSYVARLESGAGDAKISTLRKLADALGVPVAVLVS